MNLRQRIRHSQTRPIKDQALESRRFTERAAVAFAIVAVALMLLDPAVSWITGQTICVDGGLAGLKSRPGG